MAVADVEQYLKLIPAVRQTPDDFLSMTYDREADVVYINFKKPNVASDSELTDEDVILRYAGDELVGVTILNASHR